MTDDTSAIGFEDRDARLRRLRNNELDLLIALDDCARLVSTQLENATALRRHLRRVRREIRAIEIADLRARFEDASSDGFAADA